VKYYEILDLRTNHVLLSTTDRDEADRALKALVADGQAWDDLDLVEVAEEHRLSLMVRDYESAARKFMAEDKGRAYLSFRTLADAQAAPVAVVSVEGDYGGQIYATCPAKLVRCTEGRLRRLAEELEVEARGTGYVGGAQVLYEPRPVGAGIAGGMGGGHIIDGVWVHEGIRQLGWAAAVEAILRGTRDDLPRPRPEVPDDVRSGILRAYDERIDVFCHVFGFPQPDYLRTMHRDEWLRREHAVVPPPANYRRWYSSTYRVIAREAGRPSFRL
jgi:hypothetical protein